MIKNISIDQLYLELNKHILLLEAFTGIKELSFIIKSCRLKPYRYIFEKKNKNTILYDWWFDEFGNSLRIKNKKIELIPNDPLLSKKEIIGTDLYFGLPVEKITKISKMIYVIEKDNPFDGYKKYLSVSFLGIDNYFRSYTTLHGEWEPCTPLCKGEQSLKFIFKNLGIKKFASGPLADKEWLGCLPANKYFLKLLENKYDDLFSFLKT